MPLLTAYAQVFILQQGAADSQALPTLMLKPQYYSTKIGPCGRAKASEITSAANTILIQTHTQIAE